MAQDLPPIGGYGEVQWRRNLPGRGYKSSVVLGFIGLVSAYGIFRMSEFIREKRELKREKMWARIYLTPVLQAETDRDTVRRTLAIQAREKEIMKDVPGWNAEFNVYNDKKFRAPNYVVLDD